MKQRYKHKIEILLGTTISLLIIMTTKIEQISQALIRISETINAPRKAALIITMTTFTIILTTLTTLIITTTKKMQKMEEEQQK